MTEIPMLHLLDAALRGGLITLLLLAAALLLRDHGRAAAARWGAACALGAAAHALYALPGFAAPPAPWQAPLLALSAGSGVMFWIFAEALFDDNFKARWWHVAAWSALAAAALVQCFVLVPAHAPAAGPAALLLGVAPIAFATLAVVRTLSTWHADLVEGRRRLRVFIVAAAAAYTLATALASLALPPGTGPTPAGLADTLGLGAIALAVLWQLLRIDAPALFPGECTLPAHPPEAAPPQAVPAGPPPGDTPANVLPQTQAGPSAGTADAALVATLERLLTDEHIYREENLTIGSMAARLGLHEYRLRRLINQGLGHRNFNVFLNRYRIEDAKRALADPAQAAVPVLSVAMDCGFQSLGPFNRAFKMETGMTPTEFRKRHAHASGEAAVHELAGP